MSFGRTSRGLTYEGMRDAILALLDDIAEVAEAELELFTSVPRTGGKISGAELKKLFQAETFTELELTQMLARLQELAP